MILPIKQIIITESANTFSGKIMRTMVQMRKPFKTYGKILPRKPDTSKLEDINKKVGKGKLFSYEDLLKDTRPTRPSRPSSQLNLGV